MSSKIMPDEAGLRQPGTTEADFKKFDAYPWGSDRRFLQVLDAMIGPDMTGIDRQQLLGMALLGRIFYYQGAQKIDINRTAYEAYLERNPNAFRPDPPLLVKIEYIRQKVKASQQSSDKAEDAKSEADAPSWQSWAPITDLGRKANEGTAHGGDQGQDAPYPEHFKAIIEAVTTGKDVPGIREIPNTIIRQKDVAPRGRMTVPLKPWEKQSPEVSSSAPSDKSDWSVSGFLDEEFPDREDEEAPSQ